MHAELDPDQLETLKAYAAGERGTRDTIERLGMHDFADLIIALSQHDLLLPRPPEGPERDANIARATAILQPRLRHGG